MIVSAITLGTFHTEQWNVNRLDFLLCPSSSLESCSPLSEFSVSTLESKSKASNAFKTKAPAMIRNVLLQPTASVRYWRTWLRTIVPKPCPVETIPRANASRLSKHFRTITKPDTNAQLAPIPITLKATYKTVKFLANEAVTKLSANAIHPVTETVRQPNRLAKELANMEKNGTRAIGSEPTQARKEDNNDSFLI